MTGSKYIVLSNSIHDEKMIIFSATINHDQMFQAMKRLRFDKVVSAGWIDEFMQCYGESMTLRTKSRDIDTLLLKTMLSIDDKEITFKSGLSRGIQVG